MAAMPSCRSDSRNRRVAVVWKRRQVGSPSPRNGAPRGVPRGEVNDQSTGGGAVMNKRFVLDVNGKTQAVEADPDMPLLYALRNDLGLNNPHFGCGLAQCGACTVH